MYTARCYASYLLNVSQPESMLLLSAPAAGASTLHTPLPRFQVQLASCQVPAMGGTQRRLVGRARGDRTGFLFLPSLPAPPPEWQQQQLAPVSTFFLHSQIQPLQTPPRYQQQLVATLFLSSECPRTLTQTSQVLISPHLFFCSSSPHLRVVPASCSYHF